LRVGPGRENPAVASSVVKAGPGRTGRHRLLLVLLLCILGTVLALVAFLAIANLNFHWFTLDGFEDISQNILRNASITHGLAFLGNGLNTIAVTRQGVVVTAFAHGCVGHGPVTPKVVVINNTELELTIDLARLSLCPCETEARSGARVESGPSARLTSVLFSERDATPSSPHAGRRGWPEDPSPVGTEDVVVVHPGEEVVLWPKFDIGPFETPVNCLDFRITLDRNDIKGAYTYGYTYVNALRSGTTSR